VSVKQERLSPTSAKLTISAEQELMASVKNEVLKRLGKQTKVPGFREGKAPVGLVEKQVSSSLLQTEFLDEAINRLYSEALEIENIRPVNQPKISVQKFVPFTTLEFIAEVEAIGKVTLPDYTKIKLAKKKISLSEKDVDDVIHNLQLRVADKSDVTRPSQIGDQVMIDFTGKDAKTDDAIKGADGKDFPLILGSNSFIPGFETNLEGLKSGAKKTFTLKFPKDYGVSALQNREVVFAVTINKVQAVVEPKIDAEFATKIGPFKTVEELRDDIKKQLSVEKQTELDRLFENELLEKIAATAHVDIPDSLINEEVERTEQQIRQNLAYRGQTWQEYLDEMGQTEADYRASLRQPSELRVKVGLVLTEVADREQITVTPEEFDMQLRLLKGQYQDPAMQAELDKPENKRTILSRMLSEKTIAKLSQYATSKTA
jgi:trigger factor